MTPNSFQAAQAVFSPDPDNPRLERVRFERDGQVVATRPLYERFVEPTAHQRQREQVVGVCGWVPRPGSDTTGDIWDVERSMGGWDGLVPGMTGTVTITNVTKYGADVTVTSEDGEKLEEVGTTLTDGATDGTMGQQLAYDLRELGWEVAGDELTNGQVVTWRGEGVGNALEHRATTHAPAAPTPHLVDEHKVFDKLASPSDGIYPLPSSFDADLIPELKSWKRVAEEHLTRESGSAKDLRKERDNRVITAFYAAFTALVTLAITGGGSVRAIAGAVGVLVTLLLLTGLTNPHKKMVGHQEAADRLELAVEHYERRLDELSFRTLRTDGR